MALAAELDGKGEPGGKGVAADEEEWSRNLGADGDGDPETRADGELEADKDRDDGNRPTKGQVERARQGGGTQRRESVGRFRGR
jgi:hypothetical protein